MLGTGEKPAYHFTPDVTAGFKPEASLLQQQSQAELDAQAKALLQAAGYGPNNPLKLTLLYNTSESHQKIAIAVASMWKKKLGIDVKLQNRVENLYRQPQHRQFRRDPRLPVGDYNEASTFLSLLTSTHSGNIAKFKNADYDKLLAQAGAGNQSCGGDRRLQQDGADHCRPCADRADLPVHQRPPDQTVGKRLSDHQP